MLTNIQKHKWEILLVAVLLLISGVAHGYNMFHFPYYENDEGTYMSQAWSLLNEGKLAPYTYWYDHAPAGWMLIAVWTKLTGGFFTFGTSVDSGRVLMLILHLFSSALLYFIARKLSNGIFAGAIAVLVFSLSPLGIYFQRRVLLDNMMVFWVFVSLALLLKERLKLSHIIMSAVIFGIAVLTKENAIFFIPAFLYIVYSRAHTHYKSFAIIKWCTVSGFVISLYFLYALLQGEFFPSGFLGDQTPHVSILETLQFQAGRGSGLPFWNPRSEFYGTFFNWLERDSFVVILGIVATVMSILLSIKVKALRIPAFLASVFWLFLIQGSLVIDFYVTPLIPLLALNIGVLSAMILQGIRPYVGKYVYWLAIAGVVLLISGAFLNNPLGQYRREETTPQINAIEWIKKNLPEDTRLAIDNYAYVDLHESRFEGDKVFPNADWFWKIERDPEIKVGKYGGDWMQFEYIILSHEMLKQIRDGEGQLIKGAYDNAVLVIDWRENSTSYLDLSQYISTNGDWAAVYQVKTRDDIILSQSWNYYKQNYIHSYGQVIDPANGNTTSEGQAYALLRAVWQNDREAFDGVWKWTRDHLQHRLQDKLLSWLWVKDGEGHRLGDPAPATDADEDIALALLFAYKQWGDESYLIQAREIINDIWEHEVVEINGRYYLTAGIDTRRGDGYLLNPSYFSPAAYRIFVEVDPDHPWGQLIDDVYTLLDEIGSQPNNTTHLPSNWMLVDAKTNAVRSAAPFIEIDSDTYGFDAFRTLWRVALDAIWFKEPRAIAYLKKTTTFFEGELRTHGSLATIYSLEGERIAPNETTNTSIGALAAATINDKDLAKDMYEKILKKNFSHEEGYWSAPNNYYTQNWAWFGTALYSGNLPNLWKK